MKTLLKLIGLAILGFLAGLASAQSTPISGQAIDQNGQPLPYATVRVCSVTSTGDPCTPVAALYLDYNLTIPIGNPAQADQYGNYLYYVGALAAPNLYEIQLSPADGITWSYVQPGPYCSISGCTFTGGITAPFFNATYSPYFEVNGVQLASTNLLDTANIAYLNLSNVFTGGVQTAPTFNATTGFTVGGVALACANLSDCANLAKINASNTFTGATNTFNAITGTTITGTTVVGGTINATTKFQLNGGGALNHVLLGTGTGYQDSATIPYSVIATGGTGPFAGAGIPYATSTTASSVATSAQIVTALNVSPSTKLSSLLLPLVGTAGTYTYPASITTDAYGRVTGVTGGSGCIGYISYNGNTSTRNGGTAYQNTTGCVMDVTGAFSVTTAGSTGTTYCQVGTTSGTLITAWETSMGATPPSSESGFVCIGVPPGYWYKVYADGAISSSQVVWNEATHN